MKNEYKHIFDKIEPKAELEEKVLNFENANKRVAFAPKKIIALVAVIAIMITGGSFGAYQLSVKPLMLPEATIGINDKNLISNNSFTVVAYASDDKTIKSLDKGISVPLDYQIIYKDIRGLSEDEIENLWKEFDIRELDMGEARLFTGEVERLENAMLSVCMWNYFDLDIKDIENVQNIKISNVSDYGEVEIVSYDMDYSNDGSRIELDNEESIKNKFIRGKSISISGERYAKSKRLDLNPQINWKMGDKLYEAIDNNPDFDMSSVSDTITFMIEYKDGSEAQSKVQINFTSEGKMIAKSTD